MAVDLRITLSRIDHLAELAGGTRDGHRRPPGNRRDRARQRSELEQRFGAALFVDPDATTLTPAGEAALSFAENLRRRSDELADELRALASGARGRVEMVTSLALASYRLPPVIAAFARRHPGIDVHMHVAHTDQAVELVSAARYDFAIVTVAVAGISPPLRATELGHEPVVLVASPDAAQPPAEIGAADLSRLPFVDNDRGLDRRSRELRALGVTRRRTVATLGHPEAVKQAVAAGLGVALLPRVAVEEELAAGVLREVGVRGTRFGVPACLVQRADAHDLTPAQQRFLSYIREELPSAASAAG